MNFLTATVANGQFNLNGSGIPADGALSDALRAYEGKQVWFGIRPEHVTVRGLADLPNAAFVRGRIIDVEPLGAQTDLIVDVGGQTLTAKVEGHAQLRPGDDVELAIDRSKLHAFDYQTEDALGRRAVGTDTAAVSAD
jgi:multiple sugar transport system ATP-binding protein